MADFLAEYTYPEPEELPKEEPKPWVLQVDGSTTKDASGACLILTSPKGQCLSYALRFEFKTTNNEAEYEALVVGLELASAVGASHVLAKSDSQLVVGQVLGEYTIKEEVMQRYVDRVKAQVAKLQSFNNVRILREENNEADYLAKLATAKEDAIPQNTPIRYLESPSIFSSYIQVQAINYSDSWTGPIVDYITNGTLPEDKSIQLSESLNAKLKRCLKSDLDIVQFLTQFDIIVVEKWYEEAKAIYNSREKLQRLLLKKSPMLNQVAQLYSPPPFDLFHDELDTTLRCKVKQCHEF
ncbi:hypothetical protein RHSIM_RhsimUnG0243900 [Rhododendron simsii]|uniref:RNase H type-1 domain-containing protein n=1 Tax=Rhododendron simsii TaxID=118357 RepID=A0A834FVD0_RHOSS|nr:hypothetical protein RHSIM_RhsimUnG0243900 [Rhododendron simsii]